LAHFGLVWQAASSMFGDSDEFSYRRHASTCNR